MSGAVSNSLATGLDQHGSNSPTVLDLTFRYTKATNDLYILVQDDNGLKYDNLSLRAVRRGGPRSGRERANDTPATATRSR
jgi:hypothetical protein